MRAPLLLSILVAGCFSEGSGEDELPGPDQVIPVEDRQYAAHFVGLWIVEQPTHATYEATYYDFRDDGTLVTGASVDYGGHLDRHGVTGSVANCTPPDGYVMCESDTTCVFGGEWYSLDPSTLGIVGECSDGAVREIAISFDPDPATTSEWDGADARLDAVANDTTWSHDNWPWAFRRCPEGSDETTCLSL